MKRFILIKRVIVLVFVALLVVQCQKDDADTSIDKKGSVEQVTNEVIANDNGVTLSKKEYEQFEKEERKEFEAAIRMMEEEDRRFQEYVQNGGRIDFENIPPPPMTHEDSVACEELRINAAIENADPKVQEELRIHRQKYRLYEEIKYPIEKRRNRNGFKSISDVLQERKDGKTFDEIFQEIDEVFQESTDGFEKKNENKDIRQWWQTSWGLKATYDNYTGRCIGGDRQSNNCTHYLSDSFMRSGFYWLVGSNTYINARCSGNFSNYYMRRPIRAKEMRDWFRSMSPIYGNNIITASSGSELYRKLARTKKKYWAVYQGGGSYWGGHVAVVDAQWKNYKGTGFYNYWPTQIAFCFDLR